MFENEGLNCRIFLCCIGLIKNNFDTPTFYNQSFTNFLIVNNTTQILHDSSCGFSNHLDTEGLRSSVYNFNIVFFIVVGTSCSINLEGFIWYHVFCVLVCPELR